MSRPNNVKASHDVTADAILPIRSSQVSSPKRSTTARKDKESQQRTRGMNTLQAVSEDVANHNPCYSAEENEIHTSTNEESQFDDRRRFISNEQSLASMNIGNSVIQSEDDNVDESSDVVVDAYAVESTSHQRRQDDKIAVADVTANETHLKRKWRLIVSLVVLVGILIAVLVSVVTTTINGRRKESSVVLLDPTASSTEAPTMLTTVAPSVTPSVSTAPTVSLFPDILQEILVQFDSPTLEDNLRDPNSPQYRAAKWMAEEDRRVEIFNWTFPLPQNDENAEEDVSSILQFRQRYALVTFYYATNGEKWLDRCNFLDPDLHVCDWTCPWILDGWGFYGGVACGSAYYTAIGDPVFLDPAFADTVLALEMASNQLSGTLPAELQGIDWLVFLELPFNQLFGTIPFEALSKTKIDMSNDVGMPTLNTLNLQVNMLEGSIASSIALLPGISGMHLDSNSLTGSIPPEMSTLVNLTILTLTDNSITGTLPSQLGSLDTLSLLWIASNFISKTIPSSFFAMESLIWLAMEENMLTGTLPSFAASSKLQNITLRGNALSGTIPDSIRNVEGLHSLSLGGNEITGQVPSSLGSISTLQNLQLYNNRLTGNVLEESFWYEDKTFLALQTLWIGGNFFTGTIPTEIGTLTTLTALSLASEYGGYFTGTLPTEIGQLTEMWVLSVENNLLTGLIPSEIGNLGSNLRSLILSFNLFTGTLPSELGLLSNLATLGIHGNLGVEGSLDDFCSMVQASPGPSGWITDCLEERIYCNCCTDCCNFQGECKPI